MFQEDMPARKIGVGLADMLPYVTVDLGDFPNAISGPSGMPFVCIEPMVAHHVQSPCWLSIKSRFIPEGGEAKTYAFMIIVAYNAIWIKKPPLIYW